MTRRERQAGRWLSRRRFLTGLAVTAATGRRARLEAVAAEGLCPHVAGRTIRWIVPYAIGGGYDIETRLLQPILEERLEAQIAIENLPGAGGAVGMQTLAAAREDGLTLGIFNGSGLLIAALGGMHGAPDPLHELTILGRISRTQHVLVTGRDSPIKTIEDLVQTPRRRPLLAAASIGTNSFVSSVVLADLLGISLHPMLGYNSSGASALATIRGDVDVTAYSFASLRPQIESGDLRTLLQVSDRPLEPQSVLTNVPLLGGPRGWAVRRARASGRTPQAAADDAGALLSVLRAGRLIAAPSGLEPEVAQCLARAIGNALGDPRFSTAMTRARRPLGPATGDHALRDLQEASRLSARFLPLLREAVRTLRR